MDKKTIVSLIIILVGITSLVWWSKGVESEQRAGDDTSSKSHPARIGGLSMEEKFYDFGKISMKNGKVGKVFKITNYGTEDVVLKNLSTSCMCTNAYIVKEDGIKIGPFGMPGHGGGLTRTEEVVKAGDSMNIEVVYDPNAHGPAGVGMIRRNIYLEDETGNKLQFEIKVNVTP